VPLTDGRDYELIHNEIFVAEALEMMKDGKMPWYLD